MFRLRPSSDLARLAALAILLALSACAGARGRPAPLPPPLRLAPALLPAPLAADQRLSFRHAGGEDVLDARLEADAQRLQLALHRFGQVLLVLRWDGQALEQSRAPQAPLTLSPERVLDDVQLVYWPAEAIRAAMPTGWTLEEGRDGRRLRHGRSTLVEIVHLDDKRVRLRRPGYELIIETRELP
ncbi:DUF3261 domain-containing protein [Arenimonas fontis]|uniref:DUF3261 domain-containing protein n=1 Tax=Arenimonas fontis TaxID=2608255 RepID=UPI001661EFF4|nr:DUF3261 domain-containing protein [Arenimonas fontis]